MQGASRQLLMQSLTWATRLHREFEKEFAEKGYTPPPSVSWNQQLTREIRAKSYISKNLEAKYSG
jgi:hypothetical protein